MTKEEFLNECNSNVYKAWELYDDLQERFDNLQMRYLSKVSLYKSLYQDIKEEREQQLKKLQKEYNIDLNKLEIKRKLTFK